MIQKMTHILLGVLEIHSGGFSRLEEFWQFSCFYTQKEQIVGMSWISWQL